ncbi:RRP15-like protein [Halyomorpha halys]|uniref:RRP15-like protein n=1 Tax=Halyomorpha halys TaxID=286706 RepID=UPI0006D4EC2F|nr:RRP15-like protein [Halyomorpha halys]
MEGKLNELSEEEKEVPNTLSEEDNEVSNELREEENELSKEENELSNEISEEENELSNELSEEENELSNELSEEENELSNELSEEENEPSEEEREVPNIGLADVLSKILKTTKPRKKKTIVLAKAKKLSAKQVIEPVKEKESLSNNQMKTCEWIVNGRMKPNPLQRNYEKRLLKITTSGVVNLFNAVNQCKIKNGKSDTLVKKDNFKLIDKSKFLGILLNGSSVPNKENSEHNDNDIEMDVDKEQNNVTWDVLKKDFGSNTKWRNWDQTVSNKK